MQVKKDIIGILRKKQEIINKNLENIITGIEEKMNIENLPEIESWLYEFLVAVKFIEKKTMGFPSEYENYIILDSIRTIKGDIGISWLDLDKAKMTGIFLNVPERDQMNLTVNEQLVVELYSK